jgi:predicted DNA-binding transcriptional regulator YafY
VSTASALAVSERTIRRYAAALDELGIPVEAQSGLGGGYRLRPGTHLPPLMLSGEEAVAVAYGLMLADNRGLSGAGQALEKIGRVLPEALGARIDRLRTEISLSGEPLPPAVSSDILLRVAEAVRRRRSLLVDYVRRDGVETPERQIDPLGLVARQGRWYVPARDRSTGELRTFRADRIRRADITGGAEPAEPDFDAEAWVAQMLKRIPRAWEVEARVQAPLDQVRGRVPSTIADLSEQGDTTRLVLRTDSLEWAATVLVSLGRPFTIVRPDALRAVMRDLASRLAAAG